MTMPHSPENTVSTAILAGGQSRRMGRDKALLSLDGKPLIQHVIDAVTPLHCPTVIIANDRVRYKQFGLPIYPDLKPGAGSLGGVYTALNVCKTPYVLCLACDMPFIDTNLLSFLIGQASDKADAIVPQVGGRLQPLHSIYHQQAAPMIAQQLEQGILAIHELLSMICVSVVSEDAIKANGFEARSFVNLNTPKDWKRETAMTNLPDVYTRIRDTYPEIAEAYDGLGDAAHRAGPLDDDSRQLVKLALAIGAGLEGATHAHTRRAVEAGIKPEAIRHVALLVITTLGFPQAVRALTWVNDVLNS